MQSPITIIMTQFCLVALLANRDRLYPVITIVNNKLASNAVLFNLSKVEEHLKINEIKYVNVGTTDCKQILNWAGKNWAPKDNQIWDKGLFTKWKTVIL